MGYQRSAQLSLELPSMVYTNTAVVFFHLHGVAVHGGGRGQQFNAAGLAVFASAVSGNGDMNAVLQECVNQYGENCVHIEHVDTFKL